MEYVDGVNLRQLLRSQRLSPEEALAIVPPLCEALQYAHVRGIVHRDIKPENLLLDREGRVKIADFGIARMLGAENVTTGLAETQPAGTPGYMAPEQRTTPTTVDSRADIYSLGVVLYEMLTGEAPASPFQPPSRRVHIEVRLEEIVLRALEQSPELRFQTAAELRTEVEAAVAARRPSPERTAAPERTPSPQWVGTATGAVGVFALLILGVTAIAITRPQLDLSFPMECLAVACGTGLGVWISRCLRADAGKRFDARWFRRLAVLALLLWLPVLGSGIASAIGAARSSTGWQGDLGGAVLVLLSWCGMFALPWAGGVLWHAGWPVAVARRHGSWGRIVGGTFAALLLVSIVAWSWLRATQATQSAEMARRQTSLALQRAQAAEAFGANVTARPVSPDHFLLSGRLVDQDGNPMPNQQLWIVSPSYQPDLRHVPILEQLTTDAQGRFQTEVLHGRSWQVMRPKFPTRDGPRSRAITVNNTGVATADGVNIEVRDDGDSVRVEVLNHPVE
jgi:hypothetical protein